ncbi:hypothetical protein OBBRIDRAFT_43375 [Obba rivulosa]|uniref:DUF6534 domain-containing protein n=1 Tax=Obba rivulosa TaxID=1052685 RepID=A0A8E2DN57_9APHY|nr:hypothetical protein OBBRIDRAFT_43375 [Obba rivulosa]
MVSLTTDNTLGAVLIGVIVSAVLYGVTTVQTYIYYERNVADPVYLKLAIFVLWLLNTLHEVLITDTLYTYAISEFGHLDKLNIWSLVAHIPVAGTADCLIRCLFCLRVWKLSDKNWYPTIPVLFSIFTSLAGGIALFAKCLSSNNLGAFGTVSWVIVCAFGSDVVSDILLASSLFAILRNRRTGFQSTDSVIRSIMLYSIGVALLTTLSSILCVVMYITMPRTLIFIAVYFVVPGILMNSLLVGYNSREHLRHTIMRAGELITIPISDGCSLHIRTPPDAAEDVQAHSHSGDDPKMYPIDAGLSMRIVCETINVA